MWIIGIDPGKSGGIAVLDHKQHLVLAIPMPDSLFEFKADIEQARECAISEDHEITVYIEKAQSMPKNGGVMMFNYGKHFGELLGVLFAMAVPHIQVRPHEWTKAMHQGCVGDKPKQKSLQAAQRLAPGVSFLASDKCKKPHDGMIDAYLIAMYGARQI